MPGGETPVPDSGPAEQVDLLHPTLVYDADCGFCTRSARWIESHLPGGSALRVSSWQEADLPALGLTPAEGMAAAWFVEAGGSRRRGHLAIAAALVAVGGVWGPVGRVIASRLMSWPATRVYACVARNRHRMPGGTPTCRIDE